MTDAGPSAALAEGGAAAAIDRARHPSGIVPTLQNVVATVNLDCKLDLKNIALHARNAEYNPKVRGVEGGRREERGVGRGTGESERAGHRRPAPPASPARQMRSLSHTLSPLPLRIPHSALRPSSCASGTPRRPPSSLPPARW